MAATPRSFFLENLLWREVADLVAGGWKRVLIPCGATEAHGAAGLGTDTIIPLGLAEELAPRLQALIAPPVHYGVLGSLRNYPGSVSLTPQTYSALLTEIGTGLVRTGFTELLFLNGHSGNAGGIKTASSTLHYTHNVRTLAYEWYMEQYDETDMIYDSPGGHSGSGETGMVLALRPEAAPEGQYQSSDAGTLNPAVRAYPGPYSVILMEEDRGLPNYDPDKAHKLLKKVADYAENSLRTVLGRWEAMGW